METDFLVIGAGVAGLRAAIALAAAGRVLVVAKESLHESSSEYAQGGVAAALSDEDEIGLHEQDTLIAGDGLCDREAVRILVSEGADRIRELIGWGMEFDKEGAGLSFGQEGAHSRRRILHAGGDSTGREMSRALYKKAASLPNVEFRSFAAVTGLLVEERTAAGALVWDKAAGHPVPIRARAVLLATGGLGHVYSDTTNPPVATGDGVAVAYRAGAEIADIEFVQFHPTALCVEGAPRFLLSEALRGEGALLLNAKGERFMARYDAREELAPRDIVSRSIVREMNRTGTAVVYLDLTAKGGDFIERRFPRIFRTCLQYGVDLRNQAAPIHPAVHYAMGGIRTALGGETTIDRLYAAGEVAATGVHGANRLASNSLLEGLVFGARAGEAMHKWAAAPLPPVRLAAEEPFPNVRLEQIQDLAWEKCGIVRNGVQLREAIAELEGTSLERHESPAPADFRIRNVHTIATLIARCALAREESRGAHYRSDFPEKNPLPLHSTVRMGAPVQFAENCDFTSAPTAAGP